MLLLELSLGVGCLDVFLSKVRQLNKIDLKFGDCFFFWQFNYSAGNKKFDGGLRNSPNQPVNNAAAAVANWGLVGSDLIMLHEFWNLMLIMMDMP